jgi:hypothetical protein
MTHSLRRRPSLLVLALFLLLCTLPGRCFALSEIMDVSKKRAKELGITVRSRPSANHDVWVQVEFKAAGAMKEFRWADLELRQGEKRLVTAALMPKKPTQESPSESKLLEFYIDPAALPNSTVTIFVYAEPLSGIGYRLQMKDFLPQAASR